MAVCATLVVPGHSLAAVASVKLPYAKGQSFVVTQGYETPPTHIKKDSYALDLTRNGCDAYGMQAVAAASGRVMFLSQEGYNGGYGTELIIDHGGNIVSRYAHLIPDSITIVATGTIIRQGQAIGLIGDTGLVAGFACADHPGTHLHFAMDTMNADGTFSAYDPEPISGYTNMTAGKWYLSDNGDDEDATATDIVASVTTTTIASINVDIPASSSSHVPSGGVSVIVGNGNSGGSSVPAAPPSPSTSTIEISDAPAQTSTATSTISTSTSSDPADASTATSSGILFQQSDDSTASPWSWYGDNWFELGSGFSGTLDSLILEGNVNCSRYSASQVTLQEFKDKNYAVLVQEFPISINTSFTSAMVTTTFSGLSIQLKPYFYYRITTLQGFQNCSVILAGTATTTTGVAMWDRFIYGAGDVGYTMPFFPFMEMDGVPATSTLTPPPLTTPTNLTANFDELGMQLNPSWSTSTDPDWPGNPLRYEMNYSTSTSLSDDGWTTPGSIPVITGNSYLIGIRAKDNYGGVSAIATTTWNFPPGFVPYILSPGLSYAHQYFTVSATSTLRSIELFTANFGTGARSPEVVECGLQVFDEYALSSLGMTPSDNDFSGYSCAGTPIFTFASSPLVLHPDHQYHWVFNMSTGNPSTDASVQFYGTATDTVGGLFGDPSLVNARFTVTGDTGVLLSN